MPLPWPDLWDAAVALVEGGDGVTVGHAGADGPPADGPGHSNMLGAGNGAGNGAGSEGFATTLPVELM